MQISVFLTEILTGILILIDVLYVEVYEMFLENSSFSARG